MVEIESKDLKNGGISVYTVEEGGLEVRCGETSVELYAHECPGNYDDEIPDAPMYQVIQDIEDLDLVVALLQEALRVGREKFGADWMTRGGE